jgi:hypothetical protein
MRYVFPDGEPLLLSRVQLALERARFYTEHVEGFMTDYAVTLRHWHDRLDEHLEEAERLAGPERLRVWRLYLRAARHGFDVGYTAVYQIKARKPLGRGFGAGPTTVGIAYSWRQRSGRAQRPLTRVATPQCRSRRGTRAVAQTRH